MSKTEGLSKSKIIHDLNSHLSALGQGLEVVASGRVQGEDLQRILALMQKKHVEIVTNWAQAKELMAEIQN